MLTRNEAELIYERFKTEIKETAKDLGLDLYVYLNIATKKNLVMHRKLIRFIEKEFKEYGTISDFRFVLRDKIGKDQLSKRKKGNDLLVDMVMYYELAYFGLFLNLSDGKASFNGKEYFNLDGDAEYYVKYTTNMGERRCRFIILPKGETFYTPTYHIELVKLMLANNISVEGAVRVDVFESGTTGQSEFNFSSLYNLGYSAENDDDINMQLTDEQAECLYKLYHNLNNVWGGRGLESFESSVEKARYLVHDGSCVYELDDSTRNNLKVLEKSMRGYFSTKDFMLARKNQSLLEF